MENMTKIINSHNKSLASKKDQANKNLCNCRNSDNWQHNNKCIITSKIVYSADMITESFRHRPNEMDTELSKYIRELNDKHMDHQITWSITQKSSCYNPVTKSCNLCLLEKLLLCNFSDESRLINKRLDLVSKCRHNNKNKIRRMIMLLRNSNQFLGKFYLSFWLINDQ